MECRTRRLRSEWIGCLQYKRRLLQVWIEAGVKQRYWICLWVAAYTAARWLGPSPRGRKQLALPIGYEVEGQPGGGRCPRWRRSWYQVMNWYLGRAEQSSRRWYQNTSLQHFKSVILPIDINVPCWLQKQISSPLLSVSGCKDIRHNKKKQAIVVPPKEQNSEFKQDTYPALKYGDVFLFIYQFKVEITYLPVSKYIPAPAEKWKFCSLQHQEFPRYWTSDMQPSINTHWETNLPRKPYPKQEVSKTIRRWRDSEFVLCALLQCKVQIQIPKSHHNITTRTSPIRRPPISLLPKLPWNPIQPIDKCQTWNKLPTTDLDRPSTLIGRNIAERRRDQQNTFMADGICAIDTRYL